MDVIEAIYSRRSIGRMTDAVPPREVIEKLLDVAVHAPNHHGTEPWRFVVLTGEARTRFGEAVAEALIAARPGLSEEEQARIRADEVRKPLRSPVLIVVGVHHNPELQPYPAEDLQACAAAVQNISLAAHAQGLTTVWRTGAGAYQDAVKEHLGLRPQDEIAGIVYLGYADPAVAASVPPRKRSYAELTEWRTN